MLFSNDPAPSLLLVEGTTPPTPASGRQRLFVRASDGHACRVDDGGSVTDLEAVAGGLSSSIYINLQDQKAQNTSGGTFTSGAWRTRDLNTEVSDVGGLCSLASNQFTLSAGTYVISAYIPTHRTDRNQARLYNVTDAAVVLIGTSNYASGGDNVNSPAFVRGVFTIGSGKALEIQHQCATTVATYGFGVEANFATEVYTVVELWKIG